VAHAFNVLAATIDMHVRSVAHLHLPFVVVVVRVVVVVVVVVVGTYALF
jgi:hypothetical protein